MNRLHPFVMRIAEGTLQASCRTDLLQKVQGYFLVGIFFVGFMACKKSDTTVEDTPSFTDISSSVTAASKKKPATIELAGSWVNQKYLSHLQETKSPKKAQDMASISMLQWPNTPVEQGMILWEWHEGMPLSLEKVSDTTWQVQAGEEEAILALLSENTFLYQADTFQKIEAVQEYLGNALLFEGDFTMEEKTIRFQANGQVLDLADSLSYYAVLLDYYDQGREVDLVRLGKDAASAQLYPFQFKQDTLYIYELACKQEQDGSCVEIDRGEEIWRLVKQ